MTRLAQKVRQAPRSAGVYLMKNKDNAIIYVGKAKQLKQRVSSYFLKSADHTQKTRVLVKQVVDIDYILVNTELEALILERNLIKKHAPRYNILFRDDKEYPYLRIDFNQLWPRLEKVRHKEIKPKCLYFGPFINNSQLQSIVNMVNRIFPMIRCSKAEFNRRKSPCHYYHMNQCLGPCAKKIDKLFYHKMMEHVASFLKGNDNETLKQLSKHMFEASENEDYERAALLRDQIKAYKHLRQQQQVLIDSNESVDVFGTAYDENNIVINILMFRNSKLIDQQQHHIKQQNLTKEDVLSAFISQYYNDVPQVDLILLPYEITDQSLLSKSFGSKAINMSIPKRGTKKKLLDLSIDNAVFYLKDCEQETVETVSTELAHIKNKLRLDKEPQHIECIDISNTHQTAIVASIVCFKGGKPSKQDYRRYNIKTVSGKPDDYQSIREVVTRRFQKKDSPTPLPDLVIIDGGKGQLSAACEIKNKLNVPCPFISLAKSHLLNHNNSLVSTRSPERVFFENNTRPLPLKEGSIEYRLLTHIRNEAHRFAIRFHRKKRSTIALTSSLDTIKGIGPTLKKRLFDEFHDLSGLEKASLSELQMVKGLSPHVAKRLYDALKKNT